MNNDQDKLVMEAEDTLAHPSFNLRRIIKERTSDAVDERSPEGTVKIFGVVTVEGASTGVQPVTEFTLSELYGHSQSAAVSFASEVTSIAKHVAEILAIKEDDLEFELKVTSLWARLRQLSRFTGISQFHDELITSFQQLVAQEAISVPSVEKLQALKRVLEKLQLKIRLSDNTLDELYDTLENAGFDISPAF
jgi:hypothetical protein